MTESGPCIQHERRCGNQFHAVILSYKEAFVSELVFIFQAVTDKPGRGPCAVSDVLSAVIWIRNVGQRSVILVNRCLELVCRFPPKIEISAFGFIDFGFVTTAVSSHDPVVIFAVRIKLPSQADRDITGRHDAAQVHNCLFEGTVRPHSFRYFKGRCGLDSEGQVGRAEDVFPFQVSILDKDTDSAVAGKRRLIRFQTETGCKIGRDIVIKCEIDSTELEGIEILVSRLRSYVGKLGNIGIARGVVEVIAEHVTAEFVG